MKPVRVWVGVLAGLALGGAAGYILGHQTNEPDAETTANPTLAQARANRGRTSADAPADRAAASPLPATSSGRSLAQRLREIVAIPSDVTCAYEAEQLFNGLAPGELPGAFEAVKALPPSASRSRMIGLLFRRWGNLDGPGALAAAGQLSTREKGNAESKAIEGWARTNPPAAWAAARDMIAANPMASFRVGGALREYAHADLTQAMEQAGAISSASGRQALRSAIIDAVVEDGKAESVLRVAMQNESPAAREAWIKDLFTRWGSLDTDAPMNALRTITDPDLARNAMTGLMAGWTELDPRGAFDYALENRADPMVAGTLGPVIRNGFPFVSEAELRTMMAAVVEKGALAAVAQDALMPIAMIHPKLGIELATSLTDERQRQRQVITTFSIWGRNDFAAAAAYYDSMPGSPTKTTAFSTLASQALQQDGGGGATVARWLDEFTGPDRTRAAQSLIGALSLRPVAIKPEAAAALAQAIAATPGLNADMLERARKAFGAAPSP